MTQQQANNVGARTVAVVAFHSLTRNSDTPAPPFEIEMAALAARAIVAHSAALAPAPRRAAAPGPRGAAVCNGAAPAHHNNHNHHPRRSQDQRTRLPRGATTVVRADFLKIDADSDAAPGGVAEGKFGPDAILMVGFTPEETKRWHKELVDLEAEFVRLVTCTKSMAGP